MTRGLPQAPVSGISWKWRGAGVALLFSFRARPPRERRRAKCGYGLDLSCKGVAPTERERHAVRLCDGFLSAAQDTRSRACCRHGLLQRITVGRAVDGGRGSRVRGRLRRGRTELGIRLGDASSSDAGSGLGIRIARWGRGRLRRRSVQRRAAGSPQSGLHDDVEPRDPRRHADRRALGADGLPVRTTVVRQRRRAERRRDAAPSRARSTVQGEEPGRHARGRDVQRVGDDQRPERRRPARRGLGRRDGHHHREHQAAAPCSSIGTMQDTVCYDGSGFDAGAKPLLAQDAMKETTTRHRGERGGFTPATSRSSTRSTRAR